MPPAEFELTIPATDRPQTLLLDGSATGIGLIIIIIIIIMLCTPHQISFGSRRLRWAGHVARMGERRGAYRALVGKLQGRRPLVRPSRRCEDNIKMSS
jgi:hypothetical protein